MTCEGKPLGSERPSLTWFGPRSKETDSNNQQGTLFFSDFVVPDEKREGQLLSRIKIDPETGAVERRHACLSSTPRRSRTVNRTVFNGGTIVASASTRQKPSRISEWLHAGLRWLTHLGAWHTIGFGRVRESFTRSPRCLLYRHGPRSSRRNQPTGARRRDIADRPNPTRTWPSGTTIPAPVPYFPMRAWSTRSRRLSDTLRVRSARAPVRHRQRHGKRTKRL